MSFSHFGLRQELLQNLTRKGYTHPTPIQSKAIPPILEGKDVLGGAQTGTGKTAAFTLPLLQLLADSNRQAHLPRVLILTPTRELAAQVAESVRVYGQGLRLKSAVVFGGVGLMPQIASLKKGVDIIIATPGRLLDLAGQRAVDLSGIEHLVLDEADRMLDMGFIHDMKKVFTLVPKKRQTLLFSATYSEEIRALVGQFMHHPVEVEVARKNAPAEAVIQHMIPVAQAQKSDLLAQLILEGDWIQVLVFTRTKHGANRLAEKLASRGITSMAIHGNKSQGARTKALDEFKTGRLRVLVATDIAARGLDIPLLPHVVNFELPHVPEDYVHRIGRTGRAGAGGEAMSLVNADEVKLLKAIERVLGKQIPERHVKGYVQEAAPGENPIEYGRGRRPPPSQPRPQRTEPRRPEPRRAEPRKRMEDQPWSNTSERPKHPAQVRKPEQKSKPPQRTQESEGRRRQGALSEVLRAVSGKMKR